MNCDYQTYHQFATYLSQGEVPHISDLTKAAFLRLFPSHSGHINMEWLKWLKNKVWDLSCGMMAFEEIIKGEWTGVCSTCPCHYLRLVKNTTGAESGKVEVFRFSISKDHEPIKIESNQKIRLALMQ